MEGGQGDCWFEFLMMQIVWQMSWRTVVQLLSGVWLFATPWTAACQASMSIATSQNLLKLMSIESVMPSNHLILCHPLLLLPSISPSIRVFSNELVLCIRWPKCWSFSFSISLSNEYSGLIFFRIDLFNLLAVQGTLKSLFQHHSSKASILHHSAFSMVQLSHPYMITGKTIVLTRWIFVSKVMCLFFNLLSRLIIAFLPRSKCLLISWLQSPSTVILDLKKKSLSIFPFFPICHEVMWLDTMILVFSMLSFKPAFSFLSFILIKRLFSSSLLSSIRVMSSVYLRFFWYFSRQSWFQFVLHPTCHFTWYTLHIVLYITFHLMLNCKHLFHLPKQMVSYYSSS